MRTDTEGRLVMQWTEVPDSRGGTRLQARWVVPTAAAPQAVETAAVTRVSGAAPVPAHAA